MQQETTLLAKDIWARLTTAQRLSMTAIEVHDCLPSTQTQLQRYTSPMGYDGLLCLARDQLAGHGRDGRVWQSQLGQVSFSWRGWVLLEPNQVGLLSLNVAVAVQKALIALGVADVQLKWPNDIYIADRKLAGILITVCQQKANKFDVVIGIGLNRLSHSELPENAVALAQVMLNVPSVAEVVASILSAWLAQRHLLADQVGRHWVLREWKNAAIWMNCPVYLLGKTTTVEGVFVGVTETGLLRLLTVSGEQIFMAGDVQLRPLR